MRYRVVFPLAVVLYDSSKKGHPEVVKEAGTYDMVVIKNPYGKNFCHWVVIKGTKIGISLVGLWEIEKEIEGARLPGVGRVEIQALTSAK